MLTIKKKPKTEEDKARELVKAREKERKKMIKTRYGQKKKIHAKKGVQSCILAFVGILSLGSMLSGSFKSKGDVSLWIGFMAIATLIVAWRGLTFAIRGFRERDKNYVTCKIGTVANSILLISMCTIFIRGLF